VQSKKAKKRAKELRKNAQAAASEVHMAAGVGPGQCHTLPKGVEQEEQEEQEAFLSAEEGEASDDDVAGAAELLFPWQREQESEEDEEDEEDEDAMLAAMMGRQRAAVRRKVHSESEEEVKEESSDEDGEEEARALRECQMQLDARVAAMMELEELEMDEAREGHAENAGKTSVLEDGGAVCV
jgi:hypothetical protein